MSKIKLKALLEGFAWERKADGSLPTLADTTAAHQAKLANEAQYGSGRKFGKGSPYNDEPDFNQPEKRSTKNIVNTKWDAIVDEYNSKPGFKVETNITSWWYIARITNTETNDWWEVKFKNNQWWYIRQVGAERKRYDSNTELINNFNDVNGQSINELSDEEWDAKHNKPHMMWQRNFVTADQQLKKKYGNTSNTGAKPTPEVNRFYQEKLAGLEAERQQLMFDMEQEAEPEGGPIADYYGEQLQNLDDRIEKVRSKMFK